MMRRVLTLLALTAASVGAFRDGYRCGHVHDESYVAPTADVLYVHDVNARAAGGEVHRQHEEVAHAHHDHAHHDHEHHDHEHHDHEHLAEADRRRLAPVTVSYDAAAPDTSTTVWKTLEAAAAAGETRPLKMWVEWGNVDNKLDDAQCNSAGDIVDPSAVFPADAGHASYPMSCPSANVASAAKIALAKKRLAWLQAYVGTMVTVKSTAKITIDSPGSGNKLTVNGGSVNKWEIEDYDLIIIMTMRPSSNSGIAGYAKCLAMDVFRRCVVGQFNWVPAVLDVATGNMPDIISKDRTTALHEVIHVLGGIKADSFRNKADGLAMTNAEVFNIQKATDAEDSTTWNGVERWQKLIITEKVKAVARAQFECPTLEGIPLEDQTTGANAHWEARIMGPEVMSYGSGTGESYLSDLTLAFLEDTGHYIANYSSAGRLLPVSANEIKTSSVRTTEIKARDDTVAAPRSPGYLRWGRHEGCAFVTGTADDWKRDSGNKYVCETNLAYGCSPDNRMSAVCSLPSYGGGAKDSPSVQDYNIVCDQPRTSPCTHQKSNAAYPELPEMYRYKMSGDTTGSGPFTAGFSDAMDYVPVRMGYWNCQDVKPSTTAGVGGAADSNESYPLIEKAMDAMVIDMQSFGGQTQCANCRCFESSLMEAYQGFNPMFPKYGLCYRANCYTEDYLQFGIDGLFGTTWYACDPAGGKMYIPGFTGSLHCPVAVDFCTMEDPSGILYGETSLWFVWLIWGAIIGVPTTILVCGCGIHIGSTMFCRPQRDAMIARCKNFCGMDLPVSEASVHHLDVHGKKRRNRKWNAWFKKKQDGTRQSDVFGARVGDVPGILCCIEDIACCSWNLPFLKFPCAAVYWKSCWSYWLYAANLIIVPIGLVISALCVYAYTGGVVYDTFRRQMPIWATIAGVLVALGVAGLRQAHNDESTLTGILFVYVWVVIFVVLILCTVSMFFLEKFIVGIASRQWPLIKPYAPDSYQNLTGVLAVERAQEQAMDYLPLIIFVIILAVVLMVVIIISAAFITTLKVLAKNSLLMLSIVQLILAAILMWIGIALSTGSKKGEMEDSSSGTKATTVTVWQILVLSVVPACITIVLSIANICIFVFANTCPWPCLPGGDCWPGAKARKAKERMQLKKLKAKGKEARQPCRKHWGPQLAVLILVLLQMVPEFIASIYMFVSSDELSSNIDTEEAAASISKLNFFNVALGESDVKNLVGAGIYLLASVAMSMLIVHFFQVLGVSHLLMVNTKRCIRRCKSDAGDDGPVVEMSTAGMRGGKRTKSTVMHTNPNGPPRRHPKEQIRAGETVLV